MACIYSYNGNIYSETAFKALLGQIVTQYGQNVNIGEVIGSLADNMFANELRTPKNIAGQTLKGDLSEANYDPKTKQPISDKEYSNFIDKGTTTQSRLRNLAFKAERGEFMTPREQVLFYNNIEEIAELLDATSPTTTVAETSIEQELEQFYPQEEILDITSFINTEEFNKYLDDNDIVDFSVQDVLRYVNEQKARSLPLNTDTLIQLNLLMTRTSFETVDEVYAALHRIFFNGQMRALDIQRLNDTEMFNPEEKNRIANDPDLQNQLRDLTLAIGYDLSLEEKSKLTNLDKVEVAKELLVLKPGETIGGLTETLDPSEVFNTLAEELVGVATMDSLETRMQNVPYDHIKEYFRENKEFRDFLFNLFSQMERVPVFAIKNGELVESTGGVDVAEVGSFLQQADLGDITELISQLSMTAQLSPIIFPEQLDNIRTILEAVEKTLAKYSIDVVGVSKVNQTSNLAEIVSLLQAARNLAESVGGEFVAENAETFVNRYNAYFNRRPQQKYSYNRMGEESKRLALVRVSNPMGQAEMFTNFGLIKVGENLYHRVQRGETIEQAYEQAIELLQQGHFWIPATELPEFQTKSKKLSVTKLRDSTSQNVLRARVKSYIAKLMDGMFIKGEKATVEEMLVWSKVFGYDIVTESIAEKATLLSEFDGKREQLIEEFPSKFRAFVIEQKRQSTELYKQVLKDFDFSDGKISWNPSTDYAQEMAQAALPLEAIWNELKNYSILMPEGNLSSLIPIQPQSTELTLEQERVLYTNFPEALSEYSGEVTFVDETIVTASNDNNFIKRDGKVYEKVMEDRNFGKSIYMQQTEASTDGFLNPENPGAPKNQPTLSSVRAHYQTGEVSSKGQVSKLSTKEKNEINKKIDDC